MALTLIIKGRPLRPNADGLTRYAGTAQREGAFTMSDAQRDELLAIASELRDITRPSGLGEDQQPRVRLKLTSALLLMEKRGHIRRIQLQAGLEIGRVHAALNDPGPQLAQSRYGEAVQGARKEDIPLCLMPAHDNRYAPWKRWALSHRASRRAPHTMFDITIARCFYDCGPRQVAGALGMDQRSVITALQKSLWQYCLIAGWECEEAA